MASFPIELLRAATSAKVIDHRLLNKVGVQIARAALAAQIHRLRRVTLRGAATESQLAALDDEGVIVVQDFLPVAEFEAVRSQAEAILATGAANIHKHGPNHVRQSIVGTGDNAGAVAAFFQHPVLRDLLDHGERLRVDDRDAMCAVEQLSQGSGDLLDPETELHSDIFFATHKAWLYLDDVSPRNAPFVYVKGSHKMPAERMSFEYQFSCAGVGGSRRITREEVQRRNLVETVFAVPRNTLVVANTCGYHRRLRGEPGAARLGLHISHRRNPFLPRFVRPPQLSQLPLPAALAAKLRSAPPKALLRDE